MTKTTICIDVLRVWNLSVGKVYSIKFPDRILPSLGLRFLFKDCTWEVKSIVVSSRIQDENAWDCIISPVNDCLTDLPQGSCIVEVIDLKQGFMN
jgi:hypothetical protein